MKLNAGKRVLMFFYWLLSLLICAAFALYIVRPEIAKSLYDTVCGKVGASQVVIIAIAVLAVYVILTVVQAWIIFHRGKRADRGFITMDSSDTGRVRIAISAIEQMVRQSVNNIDGITDMKIAIENADDAININIAANIESGSHVPTITMNMQRAIRQFVEMNCGVAVRSVFISINNVTSAADGQKRKRRQKGAAAIETPAPTYPAYTPAPAPQPEAAPEPAQPTYEEKPVYTYEPELSAEEKHDDVLEEQPEIRLTLDPPSGYVDETPRIDDVIAKESEDVEAPVYDEDA